MESRNNKWHIEEEQRIIARQHNRNEEIKRRQLRPRRTYQFNFNNANNIPVRRARPTRVRVGPREQAILNRRSAREMEQIEQLTGPVGQSTSPLIQTARILGNEYNMGGGNRRSSLRRRVRHRRRSSLRRRGRSRN
jgi:hypothetical protein